MTDDMAAIRASDELITALEPATGPSDHDGAVDALAALAEYVDAAPRPTIERPRHPPCTADHAPTAGWAWRSGWRWPCRHLASLPLSRATPCRR